VIEGGVIAVPGPLTSISTSASPTKPPTPA
jgi:hypothetical protein